MTLYVRENSGGCEARAIFRRDDTTCTQPAGYHPIYMYVTLFPSLGWLQPPGLGIKWYIQRRKEQPSAGARQYNYQNSELSVGRGGLALSVICRKLLL